MNNAKIYKITNLVNDKIYVGQTYKSIEERFKRHCAEARWKNKKKMPIVFALAKYGFQNFSIHLLEELDISLTKQEVDAKEVYWGIQLNTISPNGYNLRLGESSPIMSDETKQKIRLAHLGKKVTIETKLRLSESHKGFKVTQQTKDKLSAINKGKTPSENTKKGASLKNAKHYTLISPEGIITKIFNMRKFAKLHNLSTTRLSNLAKGKILVYKDWKYYPL